MTSGVNVKCFNGLCGLLALVVHEGEGVGECGAVGEILVAHLVPHCGVDVGEAGVALDLHAHVGDVEFVGKGHCLTVDLAAADHENLLLARAHCERTLERRGHLAPLNRELCIACDDNVAPTGQGTTDALIGLAAHNDRVAECHSLEVGEILGDVPGHSAARADDAILGNGHDEGDFGSHWVWGLVRTTLGL